MSTAVVTEAKLGPLSAQQRIAVMQHAPAMSAETRRTFRRLLVLGQERGLTPESIARTATQAQEHAGG